MIPSENYFSRAISQIPNAHYINISSCNGPWKALLMFDPGNTPLKPELEPPTLCVGMTGFSPPQRAALEKMIAQPKGGWAGWRVGPFWEADAWWVSGSRISLLPDGNLRVTAGSPTEQALTLRLQEVNRPVAFSTPLASRAFEATCTFDPASETDVHKTLLQFESWLQPLLFRSALGALIVKRGASLRGGIYHVRHGATLLAVLDFRHGKAALLPTALPIQLREAEWDRCPDGAHDLPEHFWYCTPAQLIWTHARHTVRDLLPRRYRAEVVFYRHAPRVPLSWLRDSALRLLSTLSIGPGDFQELHQRTGIAEADLASDLACLYYAGAITTTPSKAAQSAFAQHQDLSPRAPVRESDSMPHRDTLPAFDADRTAPAMLYQTPLAIRGH
jgi:hypothetical protein